MTTAICFDLDGTLLRFDRPYDAVLSAVFEDVLGESTPAMVERYNTAFFEAFEACTPNPVHAGMTAAVENDDADIEALVERLRTAELRATTVPEGTHESLESLAAGNRLGVVTNGVGDWQRGKLAHHDLDGYFEAVVTSYEVGAHKPDPAPFEAAKARLPAEEYVMVGDDYEADVEGGRAAGFVPVHAEDGAEFWATLRAMV